MLTLRRCCLPGGDDKHKYKVRYQRCAKQSNSTHDTRSNVRGRCNNTHPVFRVDATVERAGTMRHFWNLEHGAVGCAQRWRWRWQWSNRLHPRDSLAHVWVGRSDACRLAYRRRSAPTPPPSSKRQAASITQSSSSKEINFANV